MFFPHPIDCYFSASVYLRLWHFANLIVISTPEQQLLCFTADVYFLFRHRISELPRPIALKLCHMIATWFRFIMQVQKFGGLSPKKFCNRQNLGQFYTTSDFDREYLQNKSRSPKSERHVMENYSSCVRRNPVNFGPLSRK